MAIPLQGPAWPLRAWYNHSEAVTFPEVKEVNADVRNCATVSISATGTAHSPAHSRPPRQPEQLLSLLRASVKAGYLALPRKIISGQAPMKQVVVY